MHLHCQISHAWCACTALWLPAAVLCAYWHGMHLHCQVLHAWNEFTALWLRRARFSIALRSMHSVMHGRHYCSLCERCPMPPGTMQSCHALHSKACVIWCIHTTLLPPCASSAAGLRAKGNAFSITLIGMHSLLFLVRTVPCAFMHSAMLSSIAVKAIQGRMHARHLCSQCKQC